MSINKNTMEVTRKIDRHTFWWDSEDSQDDIEFQLRTRRKRIYSSVRFNGKLMLCEAFRTLDIKPSKESFTLGWELDDLMVVEDVFTWSFCADGTVELIFHNLKDISNLYKTEEELA